MEMSATAKMKRSQDQALAGRPYSDKITQVIADLAAQSEGYESLHPLLAKRETKRIAIVHITSDRGLCGGLNTNMNRLTLDFILKQNVPTSLTAAGKKGRDFMRRSGIDLHAEFTNISDRPSLLDTLPISRILIDDYTTGYTDQVYLAYSKFINVATQHPTLELILPVEPAKIPKTESKEYIFEPNAQYVLGELLPRFVEMKVYHAILEAIASEQAARMIAMRNATDNANEVIADLTLTLNKARQDMITGELLDISGGVEVLQ